MHIEDVKIGKRYRNLKTRGIYYVVGWGYHSESLETVIVYIAQGATLWTRFWLWVMAIAARQVQEDVGVWVRPEKLFAEKFEPIDGNP
ncbi:DUF1653 domain-containing protein [Leptolyngbya sp. FACHB-16]|uniref:DUF1653 domain-containing protein n=1 Tax=unclassified Leptolyngbya TaxID=2650499 RepID=UPI0016868ECE|nr:DUF1653 domain-containing protein [Leptolyngbya sp. FACHB-16]MBD2156216.1 DUF1653 domain-containing protein [Leptolyngbya sp. FACHB-16]